MDNFISGARAERRVLMSEIKERQRKVDLIDGMIAAYTGGDAPKRGATGKVKRNRDPNLCAKILSFMRELSEPASAKVIHGAIDTPVSVTTVNRELQTLMDNGRVAIKKDPGKRVILWILSIDEKRIHVGNGEIAPSE